MEKIEVFELVIDIHDDSGVTSIALVDQPAIDSNWMAFNQNVEHKFEIKDEEKRIIEGYFMVAELLIPRITDEGKKFFVKFSAKTIEAIREKQSRLGLNNSFNLMHDPNKIADGVYMLDNLIIDNERGKIAPKEFEKVPNGSLWGSAKVDNDVIWEQIKAGEFKGFSVEGLFNQLEPVTMDEDVINKIIKTIQDFEKSIDENVQLSNKQTIDNMSKETLDKVKKLIFGETKTLNVRLMAMELADGTMVNVEPAFELGASVTAEVEGVVTPIPNGEYPLADGTVISVTDGMISDIKAVEVQLMAAELADGTMINIEPALEIGAVVTIESEGAVAPIPSGEYSLADGTVITVVEGVISDIKAVEVEEEAPEAPAAAAAPETVTEAKIRKIIESTETVFASKFSKLTAELTSLKLEFAKYKAVAGSKERAMFVAVSSIANESSVAPIKKKRSGVISPKKKSIFTK